MELNRLLEKLNHLKRIPRTGWLFCNVSTAEVENVAQHIFEVSAITLLSARELKRAGIKLNLEKALTMAIIHDWPETLVADFPYTALKYLGPPVKQRMEDEAMRDLVKNLPDQESYLSLWRSYVKKDSLESKLVHAADYLSMMVQAIKYKERGNRSSELDELWEALHQDLKPYLMELQPLRELVKELDKRYRSL